MISSIRFEMAYAPSPARSLCLLPRFSQSNPLTHALALPLLSQACLLGLCVMAHFYCRTTTPKSTAEALKPSDVPSEQDDLLFYVGGWAEYLASTELLKHTRAPCIWKEKITGCTCHLHCARCRRTSGGGGVLEESGSMIGLRAREWICDSSALTKVHW